MQPTGSKHNILQKKQLETVVPLVHPKKVSTGKSYYFVGIGGCGMSGLAQVLQQQGHHVCGSDLESSEVIQKLGRRGIAVNIGHNPQAIPDHIDCMVISAAVKDTNPEVTWAHLNNVPVLKYAQMLGQITKTLDTITIAGTHGKSTTSGWTAYTLKEAGLDPSFVIGAEVDQLGSGSGAGTGRHLVVEACEYDRSFLNFHPKYNAILNIEADHLDYYRDIDEIIEAFSQLMIQVCPDGRQIINGEDANSMLALEILRESKFECPIETFGLTSACDWHAANIQWNLGRASYDLMYHNQRLGRVNLSLSGRHNIYNSLAVAALCHAVGLDFNQIRAGLENFVGVGRRMSYKGKIAGVTVLDDYGHHPTEIKATLQAIRDSYQPRRLWCVFQPHQHSRTRFFLDDFAASFEVADVVLLPDIYFVRDSEALKRQVNAQQLADKIRIHGKEARYLGAFPAIVDCLCNSVLDGDVIVTMGAGNVWEVADEFIRRFK